MAARLMPLISLRGATLGLFSRPQALGIVPHYLRRLHLKHSVKLSHLRPLLPVNCAVSSAVNVLPLSEHLEWVSRTHFCGDLSEVNEGQKVRICGWVASHRSHGAVAFVNLRDHTGIVQVATDPDSYGDAHLAAERVRVEFVVAIEGIVRLRPKDVVNEKMATGAVEVLAESIRLLNPVRVALPFPVTTADNAKTTITEEVRLRYRHLDLRRSQMSQNIRFRHSVVKLIRRYLEDVHHFVEIETPILTRSTPEGARDYLVPSRVQAGEFYALPQSPQLFKQMLMVSGYDRYYQIARCFRDEDLRADRQPEFTQLDMELAFMPLEDMLKMNEKLMHYVFKETKGIELPDPFPRLTYTEAIDRYGSDKPDTRFGMELVKVSDLFASSSFLPFSDAIAIGGVVKALTVTDGASKISATRLKKGDLYQEVQKSGAKGLPFLKVLPNGGIDGASSILENLTVEQRKDLLKRVRAQGGDLILFASGLPSNVNHTLGRLRLYLASSLGVIDKVKECDLSWGEYLH